VAEADALALDHVDAHRGGVEQQVNDVVVEQVDLVHVQQPAVRRRQHARLEVALALLDGFSMSSVPTTRSSVALTGRSTKRVRRDVNGQHLSAGQPVAAVVAQESWPFGSHANGQSATTWISGSSAASARAAVDLAVPRSPRISTPPMPLLMALRMRARFILSWPTMAVKG
jgi:hypothetical protein